ncbi:HpcH/HpaI aldolase/citrate lyase family protein [Ochrobactrum chromiisoli]|uniref:CoA ester lyase n=1 Tax=Ochrobactrum chromiisoli TaxID=2993941 RepID=A0ABT3QSE9_9HYPH|nr:CoA ester lyase [Ochrobactrum chromiisoli]MCX2698556.1 CoA ester lyase [Ochrobactrum chromiisoli]
MVKFAPPIAPLFVPGSRSDRFEKADTSGADSVILDLEDAVAPKDKDEARHAIVAKVADFQSPVIIRINAADTPWHDADVSAVSGLHGATIMLPKAERPETIRQLVGKIGIDKPVIALIETAVGLLNLSEILQTNGVVLAAFGSVDFALDVGCEHDRMALASARSEIVWRSRAARLLPPLDGVCTSIKDREACVDECEYAVKLGFGGKLAIHPSQIDTIFKSFKPSDSAIRWSKHVLSLEQSGGAKQIDGEMIDRPLVERARRVLERAKLFELKRS